MRTSDAPFLADWFAISLRWLSLLGLTLSLSLAGQFTLETGCVLLISTIWNVFVSILAILNKRLPAHRAINVSIDLAVAAGIFWFGGGLRGPVAWSGLFVLLPAGIYYELKGCLVVAFLLSGIQIAMMPWASPLNGSYLPFLWTFGFNLAAGVIIGLLSRELIRRLRSRRNNLILQRQEGERISQKMERERQRAIYELTATLSATLNYQVVLDSALDLSVKALNDQSNCADKMISAVLLFNGDFLEIGSSRRLTPADQRVRLPGIAGVTAQALQSGSPVQIASPAEDSELCRLIALRACQSALALPLRSGINAYGLLVFAHPDPDYFIPPRCEVLEMISHQAVVAIKNARLYQDLEQEKKRIVEAQEEASKKLARDLHDGPTQSVSSLAMRASYARKMLDRDPRVTADELFRMEELARRTTQEIRHMLFTLRPLVLESEGLLAGLNAIAEKMKETYDQNVVIDADPKLISELEINKQTVIFYLVEEAVTNARKHARASRIGVYLKNLPQEEGIALLEIQDDGVGFDIAAVNGSYEHRGSLGMVNLRERTELVNGLLNIKSAPGKGTRVQVYIPLTGQAADRLHHGH
ncbi:MAG TPA: histidine kinase [Anaerolineaceae bacterium]|nr:histidine kinase [Anaerolineaceae bacterium]